MNNEENNSTNRRRGYAGGGIGMVGCVPEEVDIPEARMLRVAVAYLFGAGRLDTTQQDRTFREMKGVKKWELARN